MQERVIGITKYLWFFSLLIILDCQTLVLTFQVSRWHLSKKISKFAKIKWSLYYSKEITHWSHIATCWKIPKWNLWRKWKRLEYFIMWFIWILFTHNNISITPIFVIFPSFVSNDATWPVKTGTKINMGPPFGIAQYKFNI